jgi:shikimate kinase
VTPRAILIGAPGAGKTTVGGFLAGDLGCAFADSDQLVEGAHGASVADIFVEEGEALFRLWEQSAIAQAIKEFDGVLALGGGAVMNPDTEREITKSRASVIWLEVKSSVAFRRAGLSAPRPLLVGNVRANLVGLLETRTPVYERLATHRIDANTMEPEQLARHIAEQLRSDES